MPKNLGERKTAGNDVCLLISGNFAVKNGFFWVLGFCTSLSSSGYSF